MALGKFAVDYEQRVDYTRLRREKIPEAQGRRWTKDGIGAIITWDADNIRYISSYYVTTPLRASEYQAVFIARNGEPHLIGGHPQRDRPAHALAGRCAGLLRHAPAFGQRTSNPILQAWIAGIGSSWPSTGWRKRHSASTAARSNNLFIEGFREKGITCVHVKTNPRPGPGHQDRGRDRAHPDGLLQRRAGLRGHRRCHPARGQGVRSGGHRTQRALRRGSGSHRGLRVHERRNTNPYGWSSPTR